MIKLKRFVLFLKILACVITHRNFGDPDKYSYSEYSIGHDACGVFSMLDSNGFGENIIFGVDKSSSAHADNIRISGDSC